MSSQRWTETALTGIQQEKEELLIVLEFYESDFEPVCIFGGRWRTSMEQNDFFACL
jgi:hypothetical protein